MTFGLKPDPQRDFGRARRPSGPDLRRTLTPRGVGALIVAALIALACAQLFSGAPTF